MKRKALKGYAQEYNRTYSKGESHKTASKRAEAWLRNYPRKPVRHRWHWVGAGVPLLMAGVVLLWIIIIILAAKAY